MTDYNGWTNKETWLVNVWLGDYFQQDMEEGQDICATYIKDTINNMMADLPPQAGLFADLLNCAVSEVNCYELAAHYADDMAGADE